MLWTAIFLVTIPCLAQSLTYLAWTNQGPVDYNVIYTARDYTPIYQNIVYQGQTNWFISNWSAARWYPYMQTQVTKVSVPPTEPVSFFLVRGFLLTNSFDVTNTVITKQ
jgi:hypothetical protein